MIDFSDTYVAGIGQTEYAKRIERPVEQMALESALAAASDAGISPREIDGILYYPGHVGDDVIIENFDLPRVGIRAMINVGGAGAVTALRLAALAILGGAANNVLILRALKGSSGPRKALRPSFLPRQDLRNHLEHPYGWSLPAHRYAVLCQRYRQEFGLDQETLGEIALAARAHANLNPAAQMHGVPLDMGTYLSGRLIADPYRLHDCSLETDGACAVIVSGGASKGTDRNHRVALRMVTEAYGASPNDIPNRDPFLDVGLTAAASEAWEGTGLGPEDMDGAMVYDCFTFEVLHQLEAAGFAEHGCGADLIRDGGIRLGGRLPVNTHGGLLSEGHLFGLNHVIEAVRQLRGKGGPRQIEDARHIAVTGWGQLGDGSLAILERGNA